jgi:hypothetical protein
VLTARCETTPNAGTSGWEDDRACEDEWFTAVNRTRKAVLRQLPPSLGIQIKY